MIYLTGDTHAELNRFTTKNFPQGAKLTKDDYVIILGDFGLYWENPPTGFQDYWKFWLDEKPWTTLFIDGNHENFDLLNALPETDMFEGKVGVASKSVFHLKRGELYNIDGHSIFTLGGATSIDKAHRREGVSWWPEEDITREQMAKAEAALESVDWSVDYVLTHAIPYRFLTQFNIFNNIDTNTYLLDSILMNMKNFKHWYCGHMHVNRTFQNYMLGPVVTTMYERIIPLGHHFGEE